MHLTQKLTPRSTILVMESPYATSLSVNDHNFILSCTISKKTHISGPDLATMRAATHRRQKSTSIATANSPCA